MALAAALRLVRRGMDLLDGSTSSAGDIARLRFVPDGAQIVPMSLDKPIETIESYKAPSADADDIKVWQQLIKP